MLQAVWTVGIVLAAIAALDRRAWPSLALLALVFVQTALSRMMIDGPFMGLVEIQVELVMRAVIDLCAGFLSLALITRQRWTLVMPTTFILMVLWHGIYWFAYSIGIDLWLPYVHSENALLIAQLLGISWLAGGFIGELVSAWYSNLRRQWRSATGLVNGPRGIPARNQRHDVDVCSALCLCRSTGDRQTNSYVRVTPTVAAR